MGGPFVRDSMGNSDVRFELLLDVLADSLVLFPLLLVGRLFETLIFFHVGKDSGLFTGLRKPAQGFLEGLTWSDNYSGHVMLNSPRFGCFEGFLSLFPLVWTEDKCIKRPRPCQEIKLGVSGFPTGARVLTNSTESMSYKFTCKTIGGVVGHRNRGSGTFGKAAVSGQFWYRGGTAPVILYYLGFTVCCTLGIPRNCQIR